MVGSGTYTHGNNLGASIQDNGVGLGSLWDAAMEDPGQSRSFQLNLGAPELHQKAPLRVVGSNRQPYDDINRSQQYGDPYADIGRGTAEEERRNLRHPFPYMDQRQAAMMQSRHSQPTMPYNDGPVQPIDRPMTHPTVQAMVQASTPVVQAGIPAISTTTPAVHTIHAMGQQPAVIQVPVQAQYPPSPPCSPAVHQPVDITPRGRSPRGGVLDCCAQEPTMGAMNDPFCKLLRSCIMPNPMVGGRLSNITSLTASDLQNMTANLQNRRQGSEIDDVCMAINETIQYTTSDQFSEDLVKMYDWYKEKFVPEAASVCASSKYPVNQQKLADLPTQIAKTFFKRYPNTVLSNDQLFLLQKGPWVIGGLGLLVLLLSALAGYQFYKSQQSD